VAAVWKFTVKLQWEVMFDCEVVCLVNSSYALKVLLLEFWSWWKLAGLQSMLVAYIIIIINPCKPYLTASAPRLAHWGGGK
jgi:hypothetical protein